MLLAQFNKYKWLIETFEKYPNGVTLKELNDEWLRSSLLEGKNLSRTTFNRYKEGIEDMFAVKIECSKKSGNRYFIANRECLKEHSIQSWIISTLTVSNIVRESMSLKDRILLEKVSSSEETLKKVIEAMKLKVKIRVTYHKYGEEQSEPKVVDPYCVKLFSKRWYVLVHMQKKEAKHKDLYFLYSLDRIETLELTAEHFEMNSNFEPEAYFCDYYGVLTKDDVPVETIVLRAYGKERYYLKDLPMHESQEVKEDNDEEDYTDIQLRLRPTADFISALLGKGNRVKVLSPEWVAMKVQEELTNAIGMYAK